MIFRKGDKQYLWQAYFLVMPAVIGSSHVGEFSVSPTMGHSCNYTVLFVWGVQQRSAAANLTCSLLFPRCHLEQRPHFPVVPMTRCGQWCPNQADKQEGASFLQTWLPCCHMGPYDWGHSTHGWSRGRGNLGHWSSVEPLSTLTGEGKQTSTFLKPWTFGFSTTWGCAASDRSDLYEC